MKKTNFKKGISLIILIITIVVIIILAVTVILTLNKNNPINSAKEAAFKAQVVAYRDSVMLAKMGVIAKNQGDYDTSNDEIIQKELGLKTEFANSLLVKNGELVYDINSNIKHQQLFESIDVKCEVATPTGGSLHTESLNEKIVKVAPVPEGFVVSSNTNEDTILEGLVIKQGDDPASLTSNEFVWVPVDNPATDYKRGVTGRESNIITNYTENDSDPTNIAIKNSVIKYNGFYIGRYETGLSDNARYIDTDVDGTGTKWRDATPVVKKGAKPWNYISQTKSKDVSKTIVNTASAKSTLINSYMFDTTLNYIISSKAKTQPEVISDSTSWGNYHNASFTFTNASYSPDWSNYAKVTASTTKQSGTWWILTTGATTDRNVAKNIHDLAGNLLELTTENYNGSGSTSARGGICDNNGDSYPAAYRRSLNVASIYEYVGFRLGLYIL